MDVGSNSATIASDAESSHKCLDSDYWSPRVGLVVPTLNAGPTWVEWLKALESQTFTPACKLLIDSSSDDKTVSLAKEYGFDTVVISREEFDHGGTRLLAAKLLDKVDILVYLTQDAILASNTSLERIVYCFRDDLVASAYGRQLPAYDATVLSAHHRAYNYPETSFEASQSELKDLGIRAVFCSNSFAAYRRTSLLEVGGFGEKLIMGEDMLAALKLIEAGYTHCYCAESTVYHSHNFSLAGEFRRFFDMGVFHRVETRIDELRESTKQEGRGYVFAELSFAWQIGIVLFFKSFIRNGIRAIAYVAGRHYTFLPLELRQRLSNSSSYWRADSLNDIHNSVKDRLK